MNTQPLTIESWPRAILHLDADAFFASCEQAVNPCLKGRPVIVGKERGIVTAVSYEAKARGVKRGMRISEAKRICPDVIIKESDYETYSLFSVRMFEIIRRFSPDVEEYSIDEAFVDLTGLRRVFHSSYQDIAEKIQKTINIELGISVSIGISITKVLSKIASSHQKPKGLTVISGKDIHIYLEKLPVQEIWGIGPNTAAYMKKLNIYTSLDFARKDESFVKKHFSKPYHEIWHELNGRSVYPVISESKSSYQSISKAKTFNKPTNDETFIFAELSRNLEEACIKARRYNLSATRLLILLKTQDFKNSGIEMRLNKPSAYPLEIFHALKEGFNLIYKPENIYRQTCIVLAGLVDASRIQYTLFDEIPKIEKISRIYNVIDKLSERFGRHTIQHGSSLPTIIENYNKKEAGDLIIGRNNKQRLGIPLLNIKI